MKDTVYIADKILVENIERTKTFLESFSDPSFVIACSAIILSLLTVIITIIYNQISLKRNKDLNTSLNKPILNTKFIRNESDGKILIELMNNGIGPAIIEDVSIRFNENISKNILDFIHDAEIPNITSSFKIEEPNPTQISSGFTIPANDKLKLFSCKVIDSNRETLIAIFAYIGQFEYTITYTDIFENDFSPLTETLDFID